MTLDELGLRLGFYANLRTYVWKKISCGSFSDNLDYRARNCFDNLSSNIKRCRTDLKLFQIFVPVDKILQLK